MGTCVEVVPGDVAVEAELEVAARHRFSVPLKVRLCILKAVCFSLMLKTFSNGGSTVTSVNLLSCVSIPFMVFLISDLNLSNCHCCNYILICYFSAITSCPIHHRHGNYFFFLFATAWFHLKGGVVPSLRLPFSLNSPGLFSCIFWMADLLFIPSAMSRVVPCLPRDILEMWPHHCWASKHNYLMFLRLPPGRSLLFGCVGTYWGPGTGTDPWVKGGDRISQSAAGIQKTFQWYTYHPGTFAILVCVLTSFIMSTVVVKETYLG